MDPLTLKRIKDDHVQCNACRRNYIYLYVNLGGFAYFCEECDFNLDVGCAFIRPAAIEEGKEEAKAVVVGTHHFSHPEHPLLLFESIPADRIRCCVCGGWCSDPKTYGCLPCGFFLHPSCFKLPQQIVHPFHTDHGPLTLKPIMDPLTLKSIKNDHVKCNACRRNYIYRYVNVNGFAYFCEECDFNLDVECALIRPAAIEEGEEEAEAVFVGTHHFTHPDHPLLLLENIPADHISCSVCGEWCSDPKTYGCLPCGFFLHPSCLNDLTEEIFHPFHPYHPLTLKPIKYKDSRQCNACRHYMQWDRLAYVCECKINCSFCLHAGCASVIRPAITYEGHDHLLQFNHNIRKTNRGYEKGISKCCSACNKSSTCESYGGFRCLYCDFNLHLSCGPLPYTIQHQSHIHPLILTNCPIEDEMDYERDEFYCNACEEERDPFLPIYYCNECPFVAGICCVISEVVSLLKGEHGDVELRNPFGQFGNLIHEKQEQRMIKPALTTLSDIFNSFSDAEKNELDHALQRIRRFFPSAKGLKPKSSGDWKCTEIMLMGNGAYTKFMEFVNIGIEIPKEFLDTKKYVPNSNFNFSCKLLPEEEVVDIEDYKITRKLAPILKDLLSKYGDVSAESELSAKVKLYFLHMLCECIYSMINTKVVDINTNDLLNWWASLETSKLVGFRIQFASDYLKRVAHAYFGLDIKVLGSKAIDKLDGDIEELKRKRECLLSIKSSLIEKCTGENSMLKEWKAGVRVLKAGVGLL